MERRNRVLAAVLPLLVIFLAACQGSVIFDRPYLNRSAERIQTIAESADLVFVGRIVSLGDPPGFWSGLPRRSSR